MTVSTAPDAWEELQDIADADAARSEASVPYGQARTELGLS
jgi:hypothetical protein